MGFFGTLVDRERQLGRAKQDAAEALELVHRLEIALRHQTERLDALEGRHASLSAMIRGRIGGRPAKAQAQLQALPLGAMMFPPNQEQG